MLWVALLWVALWGAALVAPGTARTLLRLWLLPLRTAAAEDARQEAAAPGGLRLGRLLARLLQLLVQALDRLFLHVDQLGHRVGGVGLCP